MGVINQALLYAAFIFSCLFLSKPIIRKLGHKWTMHVTVLAYILWEAANG